MSMKITYVPGIKGIYGPRVWAPQKHMLLRDFLRLNSIWGATSEQKTVNGEQYFMYELPDGILEDEFFKIALSRLGVTLEEA